MAILITMSGDRVKIKPAEKFFTLEELQKLVGGYIQVINLDGDKVMIMDEEGKLKHKEVNIDATERARGFIFANDCIVGDALITDSKEFQ